MKLSRTAEYALRAALLIAANDPERPTAVDALAEALGVPRNYLSKILHRLSKAGVLSSRSGPGGGFRLGRPAAQITLAELLEPIDPVATGRICLLDRSECTDDRPCAAHGRWRAISEDLRVFFSQTRLSDLLEPSVGPDGADG